MKERPILFSAPMVRALLDGSKTQTRRVVKDKHLPWLANSVTNFLDGTWNQRPLPYGKPGDRLWVRETWAQPTSLDPGPTFYRADYPACVPAGYENVLSADAITWKPSIHMFRKDSRITLEVTGVRVERLNEISEADAWAEGCKRGDADDVGGFFPAELPAASGIGMRGWDNARDWYADLWDTINGNGSWAENPWVWVIEFKRITP